MLTRNGTNIKTLGSVYDYTNSSWFSVVSITSYAVGSNSGTGYNSSVYKYQAARVKVQMIGYNTSGNSSATGRALAK